MVKIHKRNKAISKILLPCSLFLSLNINAQYAPPAGQNGSTAFSMSSNQFIGWATTCEVERGWFNIADTSLGKTSYGTGGAATGNPNPNVISLGDGGEAILTFDEPIINRKGFDFAVFENSFDDSFLELAFVEVSTDGIDYVRFSSVSLTDTTIQVGSFGSIDATKLYNLAGKYRGQYGTPFDLEELKDSFKINIDSINYVKIIDVVGSINSDWASYDSKGNKINDPYPTDYGTGGFDLDAVGVIDESIISTLSMNDEIDGVKLIYPNHIKKGGILNVSNSCVIYNSMGSIMDFYEKGIVKTSSFNKGIYIVKSDNQIEKIVIY